MSASDQSQIKRKEHDATTTENLKKLKTTTTEVNNSFLEQLKTKAEETQTLITCAVCHEVAQYPVYAPCKIHMLCFYCMYQQISSSDDYKISMETLNLLPLLLSCPQCRSTSSCNPFDAMSEFVPIAVYENIFNLTGLLLGTQLKKNTLHKRNGEEEGEGEVEVEGLNLNNESFDRKNQPCPFCEKPMNSLSPEDIKQDSLKCARFPKGLPTREESTKYSNNQKHLLCCALEYLRCPNHKKGCKKFYYEWDEGLQTYLNHGKACKHFSCIYCDSSKLNYTQLQRHFNLTRDPRVYNNTLGKSFTSREYDLHKVIQNLFLHTRFYHTGGDQIMTTIQNLLNAVEDNAESNGEDQKDSDEMSYLSMMQDILNARIHELQSSSSLPRQSNSNEPISRPEEESLISSDDDN